MSNRALALVVAAGLAFAGLVACDAEPDEDRIYVEVDRAKPRRTMSTPPCDSPARIRCGAPVLKTPHRPGKKRPPAPYKGRR